jgi:NADH-ubiquinone oxidoreductase chain 4
MLTLLLLIPILGILLLLPIKELDLSTLTGSAEEKASLISKNEKNQLTMKQIALFISIVNFLISVVVWFQFDSNTSEYQFVESYFINNPFLSQNGVSGDTVLPLLHFYLGIDGISLYFVLLTAFITPICILSNWEDLSYKVKYFLICFLLLETLQIGVFVVLDLLMFYIFFESVLIPLLFVVGIWGAGSDRYRASFLLFLFTLFGSLWMLLAIMVIYNNYGSTDMQVISLKEITLNHQKWLWLAFFVSFAFKTPLFPFHIWLNWAHTTAPLAGSIILASIILKLATYGYLRILLPIFPDATQYFSSLVQTIAIITLIYASLATIRQVDTKGIVAMSSIAHMAVVVLGIFSNNIQGIEGSILLGIAHGFVSPALFICVGGILYNRHHTRLIHYYRGMVLTMPVFVTLFFLFTLANMSTPLTLNWTGEFLSLTGIFQKNPVIGVLGASGIFFSACYSIWMFSRISYGQFSQYYPVTSDLNRREFYLLFSLLIPTVIFGIFPNIILNNIHFSVSTLLYT